jgi:hypothetical protein
VEGVFAGAAVEPWLATGVVGVTAGVVSADAVPIKPIANRIEAVNLRISWPLLSYFVLYKKIYIDDCAIHRLTIKSEI